jgi:uncharacterized membrane protein (Fun14 family)
MVDYSTQYGTIYCRKEMSATTRRQRGEKLSVELGIAATSLGGGFFGGIVIGYALKKVAKLMAVVVGLFLAGLAYLQYQGIASMNWNRLQVISQDAANSIINASQHGIPGLVTQHGFDSWGIPLTGGAAMGFAIGFMKG